MVVHLAPGHCHHHLLIELMLHAQAGERVDDRQLLVSRPLHPQPRAGYLGAPGDGAQSEQRHESKESHDQKNVYRGLPGGYSANPGVDRERVKGWDR
eukprot:scaffold16758_cov42-Phaeocystis_antarctica.AAC.1